MKKFPNPTLADHYEYLLRLYFGDGPDRLSSCIKRAYRDLNRTLHGFALMSAREELHARASAVVKSFLSGLVESPGASLRQASFDDRHRLVCTQLCSTYSDAGFAEFRDGQAQKWLNMALKYVFVFGESRLPGYSQVFELAHVPLDNIILKRLRPFGVPRLKSAWSRVGYDEYMDMQRWVRDKFPGSAPLAVEFTLWLDVGGMALGRGPAEPVAT